MEKKEKIILELEQIFKENANKEFAISMKAYMRDKFDLFGIKMGDRRQLTKEIFLQVKSLPKADLIELSKELYCKEEREFHHMAVEFLEKNLKAKNLEVGDIELFEWLIITNSWWDTVDVVAPRLVRLYFETFPEERDKRINDWLGSGTKWLIRSAILFQLKSKEKTDLDFLFSIILSCCHTDEFFINKAIGWILRENSKRIPLEIEAFVEENRDKLDSLSIHEALRIILKKRSS